MLLRRYTALLLVFLLAYPQGAWSAESINNFNKARDSFAVLQEFFGECRIKSAKINGAASAGTVALVTAFVTSLNLPRAMRYDRLIRQIADELNTVQLFKTGHAGLEQMIYTTNSFFTRRLLTIGGLVFGTAVLTAAIVYFWPTEYRTPTKLPAWSKGFDFLYPNSNYAEPAQRFLSNMGFFQNEFLEYPPEQAEAILEKSPELRELVISLADTIRLISGRQSRAHVCFTFSI